MSKSIVVKFNSFQSSAKQFSELVLGVSVWQATSFPVVKRSDT